jgi:Na+/H+ antiporter NhaD/arsenite permease-like protein
MAALAGVLVSAEPAGAAEASPAPLAALPFAGLLLSIALVPLAAPAFWHHHFGKIAFGWMLAFLVPYIVSAGVPAAGHLVVDAVLVDYLPFIALLLALYVVAGGVRVTGTLHGTPLINTLILACGTFLASLVGTTGATLLLVRPLIRANRRRSRNRHVLVFFIILVGNIGGALTPLGDPPLFLGYLEGVPFFWPTRHLLAPMLLVSVVLLLLFYGIDRQMHRGAPPPEPSPLAEIERLGLNGRRNLALLAAILVIVVAAGSWSTAPTTTLLGAKLDLAKQLQTVLLLALALLSLRLTPLAIRRENEFAWAPIREVAVLFVAIFVTIAPVLTMLRAGEEGPAALLMPWLNPGDEPSPLAYFWATGLLSGVLDNAPTYLLFFHIAGGDAGTLTGPLERTLLGISCGAVFFGAITYIGNAPNLMVRAIAEHAGIRMPGFFAYIGWSSLVLLPLFIAVSWLFL